MYSNNFIIFTVLSILLLSACSPKLTPFTEELKTTNQWSESDLKKIQFYLSEDVKIRRQVTEGSTEIIRGEIKMENGKKIEEIIIPKGTPGIVTTMGDGSRLSIAFENGNERFLMFGPNEKQNGRYTLRASEWRNQMGKVNYGGKTYITTAGDGYACLMVDLKKISDVNVKSRVAKGRTVN